MITIDLDKHQGIVVDLKAMEQIYLPGNLDRVENTTVFFSLEKVKKTFWIFHKEL